MIELKNVHKIYGKKKVLEGVSFTARKGEITCLVGVNGVGKTTILNAIMNLTPIQEGEITINGEQLTPKLYNQITFIPDLSVMLPQMTIRDAMSFMEDFYTSWNPSRAEEIVYFFRLNLDDRISELSKGNQAKVNLLMGLALDVEYILMDEPFSGIDIFTREQITDVFTSRLVADRGVLITTHEIHDIEHLIDQVVVLDDGKIYTTFNAEEMRENEGKSVVDIMREVYIK